MELHEMFETIDTVISSLHTEIIITLIEAILQSIRYIIVHRKIQEMMIQIKLFMEIISKMARDVNNHDTNHIENMLGNSGM